MSSKKKNYKGLSREERSEKRISDECDFAPNSYHVTKLDLVGLVYSITIHLVDIGLDINLAYSYFKHAQYTYFSLTVAFMLIPAVIITLISIRMYMEDNNSVSGNALKHKFICIIVLILQLAPLMRYCDSLNYALRSKRAEREKDHAKQEEYYRKMLQEDSDVALLRVFECYLESAPQQILQITILLVDYNQGSTVFILQQALSVVSSFMAMAWCMASYNRSVRFDQEDKNNISWWGTGIHFMWHLNVTVSRIVSVSIIASVVPYWTSLAVCIHWVLMTVWLSILGNTAFCGTTYFLNVTFSAALGLVYIFNYISVHEGPTRKNYCIYYPICFLENICAVVLWAVLTHTMLKSSWYFYPCIIIPVFSFVIGMIFLFLYYQYFHPKPRDKGTESDGPSSDDSVSFLHRPIERDVFLKRPSMCPTELNEDITLAPCKGDKQHSSLSENSNS